MHYLPGKIARGELFETIDGLGFIRARVLGPLILAEHGAQPNGVRRIESAAPERIAALRETLPAHGAPPSCLRALRATIALYRTLREHAATAHLVRRSDAGARVDRLPRRPGADPMTRRCCLVFAALTLLAPLAARADAPLRVFVIRHASAWKNVPAAERPPGMSSGDLDALTPAGLAKAEQVGASLAGKGIVAVYCSPARRAQQTGAAIAQQLGLAKGPVVADAFRTLDTGSDARTASGTARTRSWKTGSDPRPPGGESLTDGFTRATAKLEALRSAHAGQAIAVVTHGEIGRRCSRRRRARTSSRATSITSLPKARCTKSRSTTRPARSNPYSCSNRSPSGPIVRR